MPGAGVCLREVGAFQECSPTILVVCTHMHVRPGHPGSATCVVRVQTLATWGQQGVCGCVDPDFLDSGVCLCLKDLD